MSSGPIQSTILKVGHHGSSSSSSPAFLAAVKPAVAIYSAGSGNSYGHPHAQTIAALQAIGAKIYGTDLNGTVVVKTDGDTYSVTPTTGQARAPPAPTAASLSPSVPNTPVPATTSTAPVPPYPSPTPSTSPALSALALDIVSVTSPVRPGQSATLIAKTSPSALCTITVYYKSGPSSAQGLVPKQADGAGNVSWTWMVGTRTTPGDWRIVVTASRDGQTVTREITFRVS